MSDTGRRVADAGGGELPAAGSGFSGGPVLGPGPEFDLIRRIFSGREASAVRGVRLGAGDDAAIVEGNGIVLSSDLSVEDVHFRRAWLDPEAIGYRASAAALSDLAAMAARPIGVLASVAAHGEAGELVEGVMRGVRSAVEGAGGQLLGGDLSSSPGPLVIDVLAVGETATPTLRTGGRPGDELWVTGALGGAAAAVEAWMRGDTPEQPFHERFAAPRPRLREALWLAEREIPTAMLDLSDGLAGDVAHLAAASGVAAVLDPESIPLDPALRRRATGGAPALDLALGGGEDYELLFAAAPGRVEPGIDTFRAAFGIPLTRVGSLESGAGVLLQDASGRRTPLPRGGFQHFGGIR